MEEEKKGPDDLTTLLDSSAVLENTDIVNRLAMLMKISGGGDFIKKQVFIKTKSFELLRRATELSDVVKNRVENLGRLLAHKRGTEAGFPSIRRIAIAIGQKTFERPTLDERFALAGSLVQTVFNRTLLTGSINPSAARM
ncbi:hypothetical protein LTS18_004305 [Coniosporium uncinatum]|uniref:Uncharacterized protein n=1 Tax=Coniosporium uncinatum TaxID=93489 RepID=A0ACC3DZK1_9PEZI|nr:hypothetical protein LTS18_004305 [Coniosporium uncinatum]